MTKPRLPDYLEHIRETILETLEFVRDMEKSAFMAAPQTKKAVFANLIIIGEATTKIMNGYANFVAAHPDIPWLAMRETRNRLVHAYFGVRYDLVWDTIQKDLPALLKRLPPTAGVNDL